MKRFLGALCWAVAVLLTQPALATTFTLTSPTGGTLPSGVTEIGGVVIDLKGLNGVRVVSQAAASSLFVGAAPVSPNPFTFGSQSGFSSGVINALGGGLLSASVRITLFDGDQAAGNFDFNQNTLLLDSVAFGNFSAVQTETTSANGQTFISSQFGFPNNMLATGFFSVVAPAALASLYSDLLDGVLAFSLLDSDPGDQFFDFTQGIDGSLINVGTGPVVNPGEVPLPAALPLFATILAGGGLIAWRRKRKVAVHATTF